MYVSSWPGLALGDLTLRRANDTLPYPLNSKNRSSFFIARGGIYHLFRSLRLQEGECVLAPDYYSGNEVAAIRAAGAELIHYPILSNLQPDVDALARLARRKPRVIYVIHYLGWPQPIAEIQELCRQHGSVLVEDCALSLLSETDGGSLGAFGDYSVFCLYKTLPVPNGGLLVRNNNRVPELDHPSLRPCPPLATAGRSAELLLEALRSRSDRIGGTLFRVKQAIGKTLRASSVRHVPVGDIGWNAENAHLAMSAVSNSVMARLDYDSIRRRRRANFQQLREKLNGTVKMVREDLPAGACPLFFPILVRDKHRVAEWLRGRGIGAVEFWNDRLESSEIGVEAQYLRAHVLELPIHQDVTPEQVDYVAAEVLRLRPEPAS